MYTRHPAKTDEEILASYPRGKQDRVRIELEIVNAIIERAGKLSYTLRVYTYAAEYGEPVRDDVKTALFSSRSSAIKVEDASGKHVGFLALVFGNEDAAIPFLLGKIGD